MLLRPLLSVLAAPSGLPRGLQCAASTDGHASPLPTPLPRRPRPVREDAGGQRARPQQRAGPASHGTARILGTSARVTLGNTPQRPTPRQTRRAASLRCDVHSTVLTTLPDAVRETPGQPGSSWCAYTVLPQRGQLGSVTRKFVSKEQLLDSSLPSSPVQTLRPLHGGNAEDGCFGICFHT